MTTMATDMADATANQSREQRRLSVFPFFVGCGRSGTTLIRNIFSSHPDLAIPPESHFLGRMIELESTYNGPAGFSAQRFLADLFARPWLAHWELGEEAIKEAILSDPPTDLADAVRLVFGLYAQLSGKPRYGDKTPRYVLYLPQIAELFPEARFVHIVRDGRDVTLSLLEKEWGANNAIEGALFWKRRVEAGREAGRALGPLRYHEVRYENLVDDTEAIVRSVCEFIELPFDPVMLRFYEGPRPDVERGVRRRGGLGRKGGLLRPPTKGLRDWRRQMSKIDVAVFEVLAGDLLRELGYQRGVDRLSPWARFRVGIRVMGHRIRFAARRVFRRARFQRGVRVMESD